MPYDTETVENGHCEEIYSWDTEQPDSRKLVFRIDPQNEIVEWFPRDEFALKKITFEGFDRVPAEMAEAGYVKTRAVQYHLNRKLSEKSVQELTISKINGASIRKLPNKGYRMVLPYASFIDTTNRFRGISTEAQTDRRLIIDATFHDLYTRPQFGVLPS